ncbi:MAG: DUF7260 family protein [archaeon]
MPASYSLAPEVEGGVAACSGAFGCMEAIAASLVALLLWTGLSTGMLFAPRANVRAALTALGRETEAICAEQDALATFTSQVKSLPAFGPTSTVEAGGVATVGAQGQAAGMANLRDAYRETVMAVDHFDRDYGESFDESLANEFGDGVATAVLANDGLSPQVKQAVLARTSDCRRQRRQYLAALDRERQRLEWAGDALAAAGATCEEVDGERLRRRSFGELQARYEQLAAERASLTDVLAKRQDQLHEGVTFGWQRRETESVYRYLYRDVDATYPVLADGTRVLERMDDVEHRLTTALTAQV